MRYLSAMSLPVGSLTESCVVSFVGKLPNTPLSPHGKAAPFPVPSQKLVPSPLSPRNITITNATSTTSSVEAPVTPSTTARGTFPPNKPSAQSVVTAQSSGPVSPTTAPNPLDLFALSNARYARLISSVVLFVCFVVSCYLLR
jgi:hypothetical protein